MITRGRQRKRRKGQDHDILIIIKKINKINIKSLFTKPGLTHNIAQNILQIIN